MKGDYKDEEVKVVILPGNFADDFGNSSRWVYFKIVEEGERKCGKVSGFYLKWKGERSEEEDHFSNAVF